MSRPNWCLSHPDDGPDFDLWLCRGTTKRIITWAGQITEHPPGRAADGGMPEWMRGMADEAPIMAGYAGAA